MATNEGHMSKLEAVNDMLWTIGESPVQSLSSGLGDAEIAEAILDRTSRRIQLRGWQVNTLNDWEIDKNSDNHFPLPVDTLKVDTVNPYGGRKETTPQRSGHINAHMKRADDDSKWLLYDGDNNSETWTNETKLTVKLVKFLDFDKLTPALQIYIWTEAAKQFQAGGMGSRVLFEITQNMVIEAEMQASNEDTENEDTNLIRDNAHVRAIAHRNNPHSSI